MSPRLEAEPTQQAQRSVPPRNEAERNFDQRRARLSAHFSRRPDSCLMERYDAGTYGRGFADVYDDWYSDVSDIDATVDGVCALAAEAGGDRVLELGVGTGRLAIPVARRGLSVVGVD